MLAIALGMTTAIAVAVGLWAGLGALAISFRDVLDPSAAVAGMVAAVMVYLIPIPAGVYLGVRAGHATCRRLAAPQA